MAEKKVVIFTCDRCGLEHKRLRGKNLPAGWEHFKAHDLCPECVRAMGKFLNGEAVPTALVQAGVVKQSLRRSSDEYEVVSREEDGTPRLIMVSGLSAEGI